MPASIYALLIGAEFYFPNRTAEGFKFKSLEGCVRDIDKVEEELLRGRLNVPAERIIRLAATNQGPGSKRPKEPEELWPTYDNILKKFKELKETAAPGDQVYIHYSGHGGRAVTRYPEVKPLGIDETLVPIDIADVAASRYVRDIEMARLLKEMADKGLVVTLVLDSCHSGGMTRGGEDMAVRGTDQVDARVFKRDSEKSLVASREVLVATWKEMVNASAGATRSAVPTSGWLPDPKGYVMLAACRENERAVEFAFNGTTRNGALTHWMLHALQTMGPNVSWKQVHDRILGKINSQFVQQTPQIEGEVERQVFGLAQVPPAYAVRVLQYDAAGQRVELNTGQALGAAEGAGYAIFPNDATDFTQTAARLAVAEITELGANKSWAHIKEAAQGLNLQGGEKAVMIDSGVAALRGRVRLLDAPTPNDNTRLPPPTPEQIAALQTVAGAIKQHGKGFLTQVGINEAANYQVAVNDKDEYEILDPSGAPFRNIRPAAKITDAGADQKVAERLRHLYKYHTIEQLKNADVFSPLAGKLRVEAFKAPPGAQQYAPPAIPPEPLESPGGTPVVKSGDSVYIHISNVSPVDLNIAMLDIDSDWSVTQNLPPKTFNTDTFVLEKNKDQWVVLKIKLPRADYTEGREILKVLGTVGPASFRFLELPALDQQFQSLRSAGKAAPAGTLEQLLADFNDDQPHTRSAPLEASASSEWTVGEVVLHVYETLPEDGE